MLRSEISFSLKAQSCTHAEEDIILACGCWIVGEAGISQLGFPQL